MGQLVWKVSIKPKTNSWTSSRQRVGALEAERKQAELVALETKRYLTRLIDSSTDAIISTDKEGKVVLFNEGAQALLGYRADEVFGRRVSVLYGGEAGANESRARCASAGALFWALRAPCRRIRSQHFRL